MNPLVGRNNSPKHHKSKVSNQTKDFSLCFVSSGCPRMPGSWYWVAVTSIQCSYGTRKCSLGTGSNNSKPQVSSNNPCMVYLNALIIIKAATKYIPSSSHHPIPLNLGSFIGIPTMEYTSSWNYYQQRHPIIEAFKVHPSCDLFLVNIRSNMRFFT